MKINSVIMAIIFLAIQGCAVAPRYHVNIDSISAPDSSIKTTYLMLPGVDGVKDSDLEYREYASYVERALISLGYTKTSNFNEADIAIFLGYGIGDPETHQFTYSVPTWGQTGISSSTTNGTVNVYGNSATYSETTTNTPTYGITGSTTHTGNRTTYFRYLLLSAIDLKEYRKTEKQIQVWKTSVTSSGSSGDLRQVFPILVAASKPYIGSNTGKKIEIVLPESDKRVLEIKGLKQ